SPSATFQRVGSTLGGPDPAGRRDQNAQLTTLAVALNAYHQEHGHYPPVALTSKDGTPLLSWRVALLPHLGEGELYKEFKLDEPWDGPHNKKLLLRMPRALMAEGAFGTPAWYSSFLVFTGPGTVFEKGKTVRKADLTNGPAQ